MSLVADVIATVGHRSPACKDELQVNEMKDLIEQSDEARQRVYEILSSRYVELSTAICNTSKLKEKVETCLLKVLQLDTKVKDEVISNVESCMGEVSQIAIKWREVKETMDIANTLLDAHLLLEEAHSGQVSQEFIITARCLGKVENLLQKAFKHQVESQLDIMVALREEVTIRRNDLIYNVDELWNKSFIWTSTSEGNGNKKNMLVVWKAEKDVEIDKLHHMVSVLHDLGELSRRLSKFGKNLMELIFRPTVCGGYEIDTDSRSELVLSVFITEGGGSPEGNAITTIQRIRQVFDFLQIVFAHGVVESDDGSMTLIRLLGIEIGEEFTKLLLKECLAESVPCSRKDLVKFEEVQTAAENLHNFLVEVGFYSPDEKSLLEYAANIDTVFSNKACSNLLERARDMMLKPLYVTATIQPLKPGEALMATDEMGNTLEKTVRHLRKLQLIETFNIPKFKVSLSVCDLVDLLYETLDEACGSSPEYAGRLFYTVRNIISLYIHVVPTAHALTLSTIPQHAALVHNNSLFLSHHANLFGHHYGKRLPSPLRDATLTTADLGHMLKTSGCEVFLKCMQGYKNSLMSTLKEGTESQLLGSDVQTVRMLEQNIRQCLHQLNQLHSVWQDVLPQSVYAKAIGTLLGSLVEDLVITIVSLQDISADAAIGLIQALVLIQDHGPALFKMESEENSSCGDVVKEVKLWQKMAELIVVLGASLRELVDRWSEGKGPLAVYFTADEAKQMIRALFQNTERRAQVLSKIR